MDHRKELFPPLNLKLGLIKQFATALFRNSAAFKYRQGHFPSPSAAKDKSGVFVGSKTKKIMERKDYPKKLTWTEKAAWNRFVAAFRDSPGSGIEIYHIPKEVSST